MRDYETSHPWISFDAREINEIKPGLWMRLGEARSKCQHLAGAPLKPQIADALYRVYLVQGVHATTAIEGNTLTEEQIEGILEGTWQAPPSRQYQEQEVRNVIEALQEIHDRIVAGEEIVLSTELVNDFNLRVLKGLTLEPNVVPGEIRKYSVAVSRYRGAPWKDCEYLVDRLAAWLEGELFRNEDPEIQFALTIARAILAHLYLAWIHPYGDGNGRTARLVEFVILARSGLVPMPASHLLSNHYNLTHDRYYRELAVASQSGGKILPFLQYAIEGFVDGMRETIDTVRKQQMEVAWVNYVHECLSSQPNTKATDRQRALVLALPMRTPVARSVVAGLTPQLAQMYASAGPRTLPRDINHLVRLGLLKRRNGHIQARSEVVEAFLPLIAADRRDSA